MISTAHTLSRQHIVNGMIAAFATAALTLLTASCKSETKVSDSPNMALQETAESTAEPAAIMVFAAASLTDVMGEMTDAFKKEKNIEVKLNLASSGTLARQMTEGELPDVFISASKKWADYVEAQGLIQKNQRKNIAKNDLVLIAPLDSALNPMEIEDNMNFKSLLGAERLSMGDPEHVPAGKYAKEALEHFGWYTAVEKKLLPAKDVRSALMVVELGEAPLGIVYRTDAKKSSKVKILGTFPDDSHKPIVYVATVCSKRAEADAMLEFLMAKETGAIWEKFGFRK